MAAGIQFQKKPAFTRDLTPGAYPGDPRSRTGTQTIPAQSWFGDKDPEFWDALKEQLEGAGADYDKADQPFGLTGPKVGGQVPVPPPLMPSLMGGTPTGGSYNPYLAKRKRAR